MLATILKVAGIFFGLFVLLMIGSLLKAASDADEYRGFDDYYWKQ